VRPWTILDRVATPDGELELRRRDATEYVITLGGRILMTSAASGSEARLGTAVVEAAPAGVPPRVLVAGLGMGITLRAVLDGLPLDAFVEVVELNPVVVEWCRGPLAAASAAAVLDPRVHLRIGDVVTRLRAFGRQEREARFTGIALDLYEGVGPPCAPHADPIYGREALASVRAALVDGGVFGRWTEQRDPAFETRLRDAGFEVRLERPGDRGRRHVLYLGQRSARPGRRPDTRR